MKEFARKVLLAADPVIAASVSIAILRSSQLPFPPELSWHAWAQWAVLIALVYTFTTLCTFITRRLFGAAQPPGSGVSRPTA